MIEVRIPMADVQRFENSVITGQMIMNRLRAAGVPVLGVLFPLGAERGALVSFVDAMFDDMVYRWTEGVPE